MNTVVRTQGVIQGPMYHLASFATPEVDTPHYPILLMANVVSKIHPHPPTPIPSGGVYTYPYMPPLVVTSPPVAQVEINLEMIFTQPLPVQSSNELKEQ